MADTVRAAPPDAQKGRADPDAVGVTTPVAVRSGGITWGDLFRALLDDKVVLVLPPGSRIGTGRINFRLLAREAETRGLSVALVSADAQVRALYERVGEEQGRLDILVKMPPACTTS